MKKKWVVFSLLILLVQYFSPLIAVAQTLDEVQTNRLELTSLVINPNSVEPNEALTLMLKGQTTTSEPYVKTLALAGTHFDQPVSGEILSESGQAIGSYQGIGTNLELSFKEIIDTGFSLTVKANLTNQELAQQEIKISLLAQSVSSQVSLKLAEKPTTDQAQTTESTSTEEKQAESQLPKEDSSTEKDGAAETTNSSTPKPHNEKNKLAKVKRGPIDINDLFTGNSEFFVGVKMVDEKSNEITDLTSIKIGDPIYFTFAFELPENIREQMEAGDYYTAKLPPEVKIVTPIKQALVGPTGEKYADLTISTSGEIKIVFNEKVKEESNINGIINVGGKLEQGEMEKPGKNEIDFPFVEEQPGIPIIVQPEKAKDISKSGFPNKPLNPDQVTWDVDINLGLESLTNATVTEKFPNGTSFESVKVYRVEVDFAGNVIPESKQLVSPTEYDVDSAGKVTFKNPIDQAYRLEYTTAITDSPGDAGGDLSLKNEATLTSDELPKGSKATATIKAIYKKKLEKTKPSYDKNKQEFSWTINYNFNESIIPPGKASIADSFSNAMELLPDSVVVYPVAIDKETGKPTEDKANPLVAGEDYTFVPASNGKGFEIVFKDGLNQAVSVHYKTKITEEVTGDQQYDNAVIDGEGHTSVNQGTAKQQGLIKKMDDINYNEKTFTWKIEVNNNHYELNDWHIKDTLSPGLTLDQASFNLINTRTKESLVQGRDFTLDYHQEDILKPSSFDLRLIGDYATTSDSFVITYKTTFDTAKLNEAGLSEFSNNASSDWISNEGKDLTNESDVNFKPSDEESNDGFKNGRYNAQTKQITWQVGINYNRQNLGDVTIVDPITSNQQYVPSSLKLYRYTINNDGSYIRGEEVSPSNYSFVEPTPTKNELVVTIPKVGPTDQYLFTFETSLEGQIINEAGQYDNVATIDAENVEGNFIIEGEVGIENGGELIKKTGSQNAEDGRLDWSATINASQSTIYNAVVTDTPTTNQIIDETSVILYNTVVAEDGSLTKGEAVNPSEYVLSLTTDSLTGEQILKVSFTAEKIERAYVLEYSALLSFDKPGKAEASNKIILTGDNQEAVEQEESSQVEVQSSTGGGSIIGEKGKLSLKKVDASDHSKTLFGASFELWDKNNTQILREGSVALNGTIVFGSLPFGEYLLKETRAPLGYTIPQDLIQGRKVTISKESSAEGVFLDIENAPTKVTLTKVGPSPNDPSQEVALPGATYKLEIQFGQTWIRVRENETLVTDQNGKLDLENLMVGKYRLTEIAAPDGYILDQTPIEFTLVRDNSGQVIISGKQPVHLNKLGDFEFIKVDGSNQQPLVGATFEITRTLDAQGNLVKEPLVGPFVAGQDGKVKLTNLKTGHYEVKEIKAPTGYLINTEKFAFDIFEDESKNTQEITPTFANYQGSIRFIKKSAHGTETEPIFVQEAEFKIVSADGKITKTAVSNQQGEVSFTSLAPGEYTLTETKPGKDSTGKEYIRNTAPVKFTIATENQGEPETQVLADFLNYLGSVVLNKVNTAGERLPGAEFTLYNISDSANQSPIGVYTSDDLGVVKIEGLSPGSYKLVETKAPALTEDTTYIKNDYPVFFEIKGEYSGPVKLKNLGDYQNFKARAVLSKSSGEEAGKFLGGAEFDIYKFIDGQEEKDTVNSPLISQADGSLVLDDLGPGFYKLIETKAPEGHLINSQPIFITVEEDANQDPTNTDGFSFNNYQQKIKFNKTDEAGDVLAGATFNIYAVDQDGNKLTPTKPVNPTPLTSTDGHYEYQGIEVGDYLVEEVTAVTGYLKNTQPIYFSVEASLGEPDDIYLDDFINYQGEFSLIKVDEAGNPLSGAEFTLYETDGVTEVGKTRSNEKGEVEFTEIAPGDYLLKETEAPVGYLINSAELKVAIPNEFEGKPETIKLADFINYQGSLSLIKIDQEGHSLSGAEFTLYEGDDLTEVGKTSSNDKGEVKFTELAPGKYILKETKAPKGYISNTTELTVTVAPSAKGEPEVIELGEFQNFQGSISLIKESETGTPLSGAEFKIFNEQGQPVAETTSTEKGVVIFNKLAPGKYTLKETKAAPNFILNTEAISFEIESSYTPTNEQVEPETILLDEFINYQGQAVLTKVAASKTNKTLAGAEFNLVDKSGKVIHEKLVSNQAGLVLVQDLAPGDYYFVETKAPAGYQLSTSKIAIKIPATALGKPEVVKVSLANEELPEKPGKPTKPTKPNQGGKLPRTNSARNQGLILVGTMTLLVTLIVLEWRRKAQKFK